MSIPKNVNFPLYELGNPWRPNSSIIIFFLFKNKFGKVKGGVIYNIFSELITLFCSIIGNDVKLFLMHMFLSWFIIFEYCFLSLVISVMSFIYSSLLLINLFSLR